jgi:pentapeptide repeat protein
VSGAATIHRERRLLSLGVMSVGGIIALGTIAGVGASIAASMGALVALGTIGLWLWQAAPDRSQAKSNLGTGLLASVVVAAAIGSAQFAIDDRRRDIERTRQTAAQKNADRQNLRLTVGLRKSLVRLDFAGQDLHGFSFAWKDLTQVNFRQARLANAKLSYAILRYADIQRADLRRASLFRAVIDRARLSGANLDGANLQAAQLRWTDLRRTSSPDNAHQRMLAVRISQCRRSLRCRSAVRGPAVRESARGRPARCSARGCSA